MDLRMLLSTVLASLVTALFGLVIGYPALRVRGPYLALITLGFSELVRIVIKNLPAITGGVMGLRGYGTFGVLPEDPSTAMRYMYYFMLAAFVLSAVVLYSKVGPAYWRMLPGSSVSGASFTPRPPLL